MFYRLTSPRRAPKYQNPGAMIRKRCGKDVGVVPWKPGLEIVLCNSRNVYSDGSPWKWCGEDGVPWTEAQPEGYLRFFENMVLKAPSPRMMWVGWRRGWRGDDSAVQAEQLYIHPNDVYPYSHKKRGVSGFVTQNLKNVEDILRRGETDSLIWSGSQIEVGFSEEPSEESLSLLGWKRLPCGSAVDTVTPLGEGALASSLLLPGHDPQLWEGLSEASIQTSGAQGCAVSGVTVTDPLKAAKYFPGFGKIPAGCRVVVENSWYWHRIASTKGSGMLAFKQCHMPPLKGGTQKVSLLRGRMTGGTGSFMFSPHDVDFSVNFRPVIGSYCKGTEEEKCLVVASPANLRYASSVKRTHIVVRGRVKSYKVFSNFRDGRITAGQKMLGANRVKRLPKNDPEKLEKLIEMYGDAVPEDYYNYPEEDIRKMDEALRKVKSEGFCEWDEAVGKSIVPSDIFRKILDAGLVKTKVPNGTVKYYQPVRAQDLETDPEIIRTIVDFAHKNEQAWLIHLVCLSPSAFKGALLSKSFS